jgi:hypothetical protein
MIYATSTLQKERHTMQLNGLKFKYFSKGGLTEKKANHKKTIPMLIILIYKILIFRSPLFPSGNPAHLQIVGLLNLALNLVL